MRIYLPRYDKYGPKLGDTGGGTGKVRYAIEPICCAAKKKKKKKKRLRTSSGTWFWIYSTLPLLTHLEPDRC